MRWGYLSLGVIIGCCSTNVFLPVSGGRGEQNSADTGTPLDVAITFNRPPDTRPVIENIENFPALQFGEENSKLIAGTTISAPLSEIFGFVSVEDELKFLSSSNFPTLKYIGLDFEKATHFKKLLGDLKIAAWEMAVEDSKISQEIVAGELIYNVELSLSDSSSDKIRKDWNSILEETIPNENIGLFKTLIARTIDSELFGLGEFKRSLRVRQLHDEHLIQMDDFLVDATGSEYWVGDHVYADGKGVQREGEDAPEIPKFYQSLHNRIFQSR